MTKADVQHPLGRFAEHRSCCSIRTFKEGGCKIILPGSAGTWICLSGTAYQREHAFTDKLCDLMFAWERIQGAKVSAPVELKGGGVDVPHVHRQLQNGADIIADLLKGIELVAFLPVLVHQSMSTMERRTLGNYKISFRGKKIGIVTLKSGGRIGSLPW